MTSLEQLQTEARLAVLVAIATVSPRAADWLNRDTHSPGDEGGEVTVQTVIWYAIAAAGAFTIAALIYNAMRTQAQNTSNNLNNPGPIPAGG